ncbi:YcnI family protein [Streptomyces sp. CWNU-1]|uniref:YcnI family protein n=2 Tax=Streptomyces albipurpureus TaxID=2897419 RepID=A0ABT0UUV7_9ACTN|nr:YcnI family protein [Streptomyces sp. CWNU-1]MCM2391420.1 YcnI family protein [Streptomyces sp. CWNU-1]
MSLSSRMPRGASSSVAARRAPLGALRSVAVLAGATVGSALLLSGTAFAHVSVQPQGEAAKGGYATVNFKVPNERDTASTVKLEVNLPTEHPLASVLPQPVPGWTVQVTKSKLAKPLEVHGNKITEAASKITWTSAGGKIGPGQFQQFPVSLGQLPENADQLVFKALQTYDNKEVVRWIEAPKEGAEPTSPAPVLELTAAEGGHHGGTKGGDDAKNSSGSKDGDHGKEHVTASGDDSDGTARVLAVVGIAVGAAGVAFGVLAGRRRTS